METRVISLVSKKIFKKLSSQKNGGRLKLSPAEETTILFCPGLLSSEWRIVLQKVPSEANPKVRNHGEGPY